METKNLLDNLKKLLQKDGRLVSEGELLKNKIIELALKLDKDLIKLLLSDAKMKGVFFTEVDGTLVFDKDKFLRFVSSKDFLPDSFTAFKNRIGLTIDGGYLSEKKEVVLSWPYKDCVLEGGMTKEDQKRDEIFWNETLAPDEISRLFDPKVFTNAKRIDKNGEHKLDGFRTDEDGSIKDNLIIKGNNLLALHSLKKRFAGKVKLIYIDPLYNRKSDNFYNDSFKHSSWLTFMENRLRVAKELLKPEGVIFISIDDEEQAYLKVLCDEIFDRDNFIASMPWKGRGGRQDAAHVADIHEHVLFFAKDKKKFIAGGMEKQDEKYPKFDEGKKLYYKTQLARKWGSNSRRKDRPNLYYPIKSPTGAKTYPKLPDGSDGCWRWSKKRMEKEVANGNIEFLKEGGEWIVYQKIYAPKEGEIRTKKFNTWLDDVGTTADGTKELVKLLGEKVLKYFKYPKPPSLIKRCLQIGNVKGGDIVLDFFSGSGTTAQAVLELNEEDGGNRQFILCEQLDYVDTVTVPRIKKVIQKLGGGDFVYLELMKWNENFVDKIRKAETKDKLAKLWETMKKKAFLSYKVDVKAVDENAKDFADLSLEDQKKFLPECLDKNHLYINYSEIDDEEYGVSEEDKRLNKEFYKS